MGPQCTQGLVPQCGCEPGSPFCLCKPFLLGPDSYGVMIALVILLALGFLSYIYVGEALCS